MYKYLRSQCVNLSIHLLSYLIDEIEQLTDVVGDRRRVRIQALQMLLVDLADAFHALVDTFVVTVGPGFRTRIGLDEQDCVRHAADERRGRENTQLGLEGLLQHSNTDAMQLGSKPVKWN